MCMSVYLPSTTTFQGPGSIKPGTRVHLKPPIPSSDPSDLHSHPHAHLHLHLTFTLPSATWEHTPISVSTGWAMLSNKHPHTAPHGTGRFDQTPLSYSLFLLFPLLPTPWTHNLCSSQCRTCCASVTSSPRFSIAQPLWLLPAHSGSVYSLSSSACRLYELCREATVSFHVNRRHWPWWMLRDGPFVRKHRTSVSTCIEAQVPSSRTLMTTQFCTELHPYPTGTHIFCRLQMKCS